LTWPAIRCWRCSQLPIPETRRAESDGPSVAWQAFGSGAQDLVIVRGVVSHLGVPGEWPSHRGVVPAEA
jgi:hypothetical protein